MARKKKPQEDQQVGAPEWIVTFSDIISLLVTFFVMILTFSTMEPEEKNRAVGFLRGAMGVMTRENESSRKAIQKDDTNLADRDPENGQEIPFSRSLEKLEDELQELRVRLMRGEELKIDQIEDGVRIRLQGDRLFNPGSHRLRLEHIPVVREVADVLGYYPNRVIVEGHTDTAFVGDSEFSPGYELAAGMAASVAEVLIREGPVPRERISVASYGASRPIASNTTPQGRVKNRRVDILILKEKQGP